jgi:RNA polymerase sigma factor (TIGR02999 family)
MTPTLDPTAPDVTGLLLRWSRGDREARDALMPLVYDELRRIAGSLIGRERADHTLQATALLNEAYVRLVEPGAGFADRAHFLRTASRAMRNVLVDHARARLAKKRGGGRRVDLDAEGLAVHEDTAGLLAVHETLQRFAELDPQLAQLVELRFFGGLDNPAIAEALGMSLRSVERGWRTARAFLQREMEIQDDGQPD